MNKLYRLLRYDWPLHMVLLLTNLLPDNVFIMKIRGVLLKPFFKSCGKNLTVASRCIFYNSFNISIGDDVFIAIDNWFSASTEIRIGNQVMFGPKSIIISGNHCRANRSFRFGSDQYAPIVVKDGSWIGGNCAILAGAEIGFGSLIGANTVVNKVVPDDVLFAGNPGRIIKQIVDS